MDYYSDQGSSEDQDLDETDLSYIYNLEKRTFKENIEKQFYELKFFLRDNGYNLLNKATAFHYSFFIMSCNLFNINKHFIDNRLRIEFFVKNKQIIKRLYKELELNEYDIKYSTFFNFVFNYSET